MIVESILGVAVAIVLGAMALAISAFIVWCGVQAASIIYNNTVGACFPSMKVRI